MKLKVPPLTIDENEGFTPQKDIFNRKFFAEKLTNIIRETDDELVIALDAKWGAGKTTFVKMWRGYLKQNNIQSIYFDAFENDFVEDPMIALTGEILALIKEEKKEEFKKKAISAIKVVTRAGLKIGIKALTAGVLDETVLEGNDYGKEISSETSDIVDKYIGERLESLKKDKLSVDHFKNSLTGITKSISDTPSDNPLVFIIDELDRCKPTFALDIIERIKHIFSVPKIVFILVMNRAQLEEIIRSRYGRNIEASLYLNKFIHIWIDLPNNKTRYGNNGKTYLKKCLENMEFKEMPNHGDVFKIYYDLIDHYHLTFRDIERSLTNFAMIENMSTGKLSYEDYSLLVFLSIIRVIKPYVYNKIKLDSIQYSGPDGLFESAELEGLIDDKTHEDSGDSHVLIGIIKHDLETDERATALRNKVYSMSRRIGVMKEICSWFENIRFENS